MHKLNRMSTNQATNQYAMTVGLYLGAAYTLVIFAGHLFGVTHYPGDSLAYFNMMIFIVAGNFAGRRYQIKVSGEPLSYWQAFGLLVKFGFFSSVVFGFFAFFYYQYIQPPAVDNYISIMAENLKQVSQMTDEQRDAMVQLYKSSLSPGGMAFLTWFSQVLASILFSFVSALLIKTPQKTSY